MDANALRNRLLEISKRTERLNDATSTLSDARENEILNRAESLRSSRIGGVPNPVRTSSSPLRQSTTREGFETDAPILDKDDCDTIAMGITKFYGGMIEDVAHLCRYDYDGFSDYIVDDRWVTTCIKAICRKKLPSAIDLENRPFTTLSLVTIASMASFQRRKRIEAGMDFKTKLRQRAEQIRRDIMSKYAIPVDASESVCVLLS